ncbi:hypothetical protein L9F63_016699 [Diploptera punctata]|uniref:Uncharacterized protein n=1 Tax=Diploptera punctata TaxID=6984 RepID=A0AAD8A0L0_DIPPU|nr:hypothetical protein L9F63_016699 [Diploptera punctata]
MGSCIIFLTATLTFLVLQGVECNIDASYNRPYEKDGYQDNTVSQGQVAYEKYGPPRRGHKTRRMRHEFRQRPIMSGVPGQNDEYPNTLSSYNGPANNGDIPVNVNSNGNEGIPGSLKSNRFPIIQGPGPENNLNRRNVMSSPPSYGPGSYPNDGGFPNNVYFPNVPSYGRRQSGYKSGIYPPYVPDNYEGEDVFKRGDFISQIPYCEPSSLGEYGNYGDVGDISSQINGYGNYGYGDYGSYDKFGQGNLLPYNNQVGYLPYYGHGGNGGYGKQGTIGCHQQGYLYPSAQPDYGGYGRLFPNYSGV